MRTGFAKLSESARGWIHQAGNDGFIKLVADADRGILVGATSVGPVGGEVLSMLTLAVHARVPVRPAGPDDLRIPDVPPGYRASCSGAGLTSPGRGR